ncbi:bifunctional demethylmenaquinone methyltransferase/2-methoxy-6-polyprenyl-1,4-benzoquinol methylase UbiE [Sandaracinus amylolyticus]|uniref:Demethylmenaquinone methyltransferase n=1 Tax=Sandaracinus amylolyticus TaxID=927083 RepID=A0A0F6WAB5_9BACT|nr:bifunctional demethylmenaquinone methyltransferase/2-methoxy-6-polyprenyl-1,4-benzoquinol methylase UbiE [Sandaracinus amylolyticus]AKF11442.1 2-heptaprenyl-1,4-naphthoquinone methyltransferase [Sandaracinus amylolyticus]
MGQEALTTVRPGSGEFFDAIAKRYDLLNRIISLGIDQGWRIKTVRALGLAPGMRVLDLATGTADLAIMTARRSAGVDVVGIDPSREMLAIGRTKVSKGGLDTRVTLLEGDAQQIAQPDDCFDAITIAFGIRNVPDRARALREMVRVGKPGARVAILELGEPRSGILGPLARFHVHVVVPTIGALLSGAKEYRYLQTSIAAFPEPETFAQQMRDAGMADVKVHPLTFGVCHLYTGRVPEGAR